jgi:hypothetical protein
MGFQELAHRSHEPWPPSPPIDLRSMPLVRSPTRATSNICHLRSLFVDRNIAPSPKMEERLIARELVDRAG